MLFLDCGKPVYVNLFEKDDQNLVFTFITAFLWFGNVAVEIVPVNQVDSHKDRM